MKTFLAVFLCFLTVGSAVPKITDWHKAKTAPVHVGIDDELREFTLSYTTDAVTHGIKFKKPVSMGFSEIKWKKGKGTVVGLCTYGKNFREIDIDPKYWKESTWKTKRSLDLSRNDALFVWKVPHLERRDVPRSRF